MLLTLLRYSAFCGIGYLTGAGVSCVAILGLSQNRHDRKLEAAMTAAFVFGPIGGLAGMILAWFM